MNGTFKSGVFLIDLSTISAHSAMRFSTVSRTDPSQARTGAPQAPDASDALNMRTSGGQTSVVSTPIEARDGAVFSETGQDLHLCVFGRKEPNRK